MYHNAMNSTKKKKKIYHVSIASRSALGHNQPRIQWAPGVRRPRHGADHSFNLSYE